jgi:hypothetical protein
MGAGTWARLPFSARGRLCAGRAPPVYFFDAHHARLAAELEEELHLPFRLGGRLALQLNDQ